MALSPQMKARIRAARYHLSSEDGAAPRRGEDIFTGGYPRDWTELVGQRQAVDRLKAAITSAQAEGRRLDHVLLASGLHGVGKSTLARLIAGGMGVGFCEVSGPVTVDEARRVLRGMEDHDVLFWDECHQAVQGGKGKAEWALHLLQDGRLLTAAGIEQVADITVVMATTDAQRLPQTVLSRLPIRPVIVAPNEFEAFDLVCTLAAKMGLEVPNEVVTGVAAAANGSPRDMKALLIAARDGYAVDQRWDMDRTLEWCGVTCDGLNTLAQEYLMVLLVQCNGMAGQTTIASALSEPGPLHHTEQLLATKGFIEITPQGRRMTTAGAERTVALVEDAAA